LDSEAGDGQETLCSAHRRINDKFPAGIVQLHGPFVGHQAQQIVSLARDQEEAERGRASANSMNITTTLEST